MCVALDFPNQKLPINVVRSTSVYIRILEKTVSYSLRKAPVNYLYNKSYGNALSHISKFL